VGRKPREGSSPSSSTFLSDVGQAFQPDGVQPLIVLSGWKA